MTGVQTCALPILPLAMEVSKAGFKVIGLDVDENKVNMLNSGKSYIPDVLDNELSQEVKSNYLSASKDLAVLASADIIIICVPTPLTEDEEPDLTFVLEAVEQCAANLRQGQLITLESTTFPGTTEEVVLTRLQEKTGLRVGEDFFLAFSPERIDPGNVTFKTKNITKVVGWVTSACTEMASTFYKQIIDQVITVSSPAAAEMTKVFENTFRSVNIALVNEMMFVCDQMGIDVWEVIDAAGTKPFGIQTFYPGPGVGGHCIPIDPHYLSWKVKKYGFNARLIETAGQINREAVDFVLRKIERVLKGANSQISQSRILVLGVAYKRDIGDCRESPALKIMAKLHACGAVLSYYDPYVPVISLDEGVQFTAKAITFRELNSVDCVLIATDHSCINYQWVVDCARLVIDTRYATKNIERGRAKIVRKIGRAHV